MERDRPRSAYDQRDARDTPQTDGVELPNDPRLQAALELLAAGVEEILTSDGFRRYLATMGRFHHYSANNILLIMTQRPDATQVAGYTRWKALGRWVKPGERGLKIFAPVLRTQSDPETGDERRVLTGYRLATVFDLRQTDGTPLPQPPRPVDLGEGSDEERAARLYERTQAWLTQQGITVRRGPFPGGTTIKGEYRPAEQRIRVNWALGQTQATKTLVHEAAHYVADHRGWQAGADVETVAEASAFVVCNQAGIDTRDYSFPYVARWAQDQAVLARNLEQIRGTSHALIQGIIADEPGRSGAAHDTDI